MIFLDQRNFDKRVNVIVEDLVNYVPRPIKTGNWVICFHFVCYNKPLRFGCLSNADPKTTVREIFPFILITQEPRNLFHESYFTLGRELVFKEAFHFVRIAEVPEKIYI